MRRYAIRLSHVNLLFSCFIVVWMVTPYLFRNISPIYLIIVFFGWLFSFLPYMRISKGCGLIPPIMWFAYVLIYKLIGFSSASWGNYVVQFFFWLNIFVGYNCYKNYDNRSKSFFAMFVWWISFANILDNIFLLIRYPDASTSLYQSWGVQYLSMNVGDTSFSYYAVFFFFFNMANMFLYKKHRLLSFVGVLTSLVYIYMSARTTTYLMLVLIIMCWAISKFSSTASRRNPKMVFLLAGSILAIFAFCAYPLLVETLVSLNSDSNIVKRLIEISNIVYGTDYSTVDSGTVRLANTFLSLKTWLSSIQNFLFGVGFDGKYAGTVAVQEFGVGQHSDTLDTFARYGIVGGLLYINTMVSTIRVSVGRIENKDFYKWIYYSLVIYSLMNSFMNSSLLGLFVFVVYPLYDSLKSKRNDLNQHQIQNN